MAWTGHDKYDFAVLAEYINKGKPSEQELMNIYYLPEIEKITGNFR